MLDTTIQKKKNKPKKNNNNNSYNIKIFSKFEINYMAK